MQKNDLGRAIVEGACNPAAKDTMVEVSEIGIDCLLEEGLLKELPVIRSIIACRATWNTIHDQLFLKKVALFIEASPKFSEVERESFVRLHLNEAKQAKRLYDAIVLILDKLDDVRKPEMLARAFAAFVRGKIPLETFRRLSAAIDIGFVDDLYALRDDASSQENLDLMRQLLRTGLVQMADKNDHVSVTIKGSGMVWLTYQINPLGNAFIQCMNELP